MAYLLSNICTKNYWNWTTIVEIIVGGWMISFFETQCICGAHWRHPANTTEPFMFGGDAALCQITLIT